MEPVPRHLVKRLLTDMMAQLSLHPLVVVDCLSQAGNRPPLVQLRSTNTESLLLPPGSSINRHIQARLRQRLAEEEGSTKGSARAPSPIIARETRTVTVKKKAKKSCPDQKTMNRFLEKDKLELGRKNHDWKTMKIER